MDLQTRMSASLTIPGMTILPKTFEDLAESDYQINFFGYPLQGWETFQALVSGNNSLAAKLNQKIADKYTISKQV